MLCKVQTLNINECDSTPMPTDSAKEVEAHDEQGRPTRIALLELAFFDVALDPEQKDNMLHFPELDGYSWCTFEHWALSRRTPYEIIGTAWIWFHTALHSTDDPKDQQCSGVLLLSWHEFARHVWHFLLWINKHCHRGAQQILDVKTAVEDAATRCALAELAQLIYWTLCCFREDIIGGKVPRTGRDVRSWQLVIAQVSQNQLCDIAEQYQVQQLLRMYIENNVDERTDVFAMKKLEMLFRTLLMLSSKPVDNVVKHRRKFQKKLKEFVDTYKDEPQFLREECFRHRDVIHRCWLGSGNTQPGIKV